MSMTDSVSTAHGHPLVRGTPACCACGYRQTQLNSTQLSNDSDASAGVAAQRQQLHTPQPPDRRSLSRDPPTAPLAQPSTGWLDGWELSAAGEVLTPPHPSSSYTRVAAARAALLRTSSITLSSTCGLCF